jgi:hypothetical protein
MCARKRERRIRRLSTSSRCELRSGQYWRTENLESFDEFLERRFPQSRRKAYYLMSIHERLPPPQVRKSLKDVGWTKGLDLAKLARKQGERFESATWLHKARALPKEDFKREVEKELTGKDSEPSELILLWFTRLEVHHNQFRSQAGHDSEENLVTLCAQCHAQITIATTQRPG